MVGYSGQICENFEIGGEKGGEKFCEIYLARARSQIFFRQNFGLLLAGGVTVKRHFSCEVTVHFLLLLGFQPRRPLLLCPFRGRTHIHRMDTPKIPRIHSNSHCLTS